MWKSLKLRRCSRLVLGLIWNNNIVEVNAIIVQEAVPTTAISTTIVLFHKMYLIIRHCLILSPEILAKPAFVRRSGLDSQGDMRLGCDLRSHQTDHHQKSEPALS